MFYLLHHISRFLSLTGTPKGWSKFSVKTKNGVFVNFSIVDLPKSLTDQLVNLYINHFVKEEKTYIASGVPKSAKAMEELQRLILGAAYAEIFHIVVCCLDKDDGQIKDIVGASIMSLISQENPELEIFGSPGVTFVRRRVSEEYRPDCLVPTAKHGGGSIMIWGCMAAEGAGKMFVCENRMNGEKYINVLLDIKSKEIKKLFQIVRVLENYYDEVKAFNLNPCFSDRGLFVCPEYRGLGIAQELLKVRRLICKDHGIPINGAWMTSYGTQKAAERDGWETVCEIQYEELEKNLGIKFGREPPSSKFMIARIQ